MKDRDIPIYDFLEILQKEYFYYEYRTKIYPIKEDRENFKKVMEFKKAKILDISNKNGLNNIFNNEEKLIKIRESFFDENGIPVRLAKRDWYFYYKIGSAFSYKGEQVFLKSYDLIKNTAKVKKGEDLIDVNLQEIRKII